MYKNKSRKPQSRRPLRTIRKRKAPSKLRVTKAVKSYVKRAIHVKQELKHASPLVRQNVAIRGYGMSGGPSQLTCEDITTVLTIPQGTADGQRVGDKIKVKSLNIKGFINLDSSFADNPIYRKNPMYVKMFVGRRVDTVNDPNTITGGFSKFLAAGPVAAAPTNLPPDMYRYVNKELYRVYATRIFKIGVSAPSNVPNDSAQWNNDFKFSKNFSISLNKHIDTVKYSDGGNIPSNVGFYVWFLVCFANGSAINLVDNNTPLEWHYDVNCTYYDA